MAHQPLLQMVIEVTDSSTQFTHALKLQTDGSS